MSSNDLLEAMQKSLEEGRIDDLKKVSEKYISEFPESSKGYLFLGKANLKNQDPLSAKVAFYKASDNDPNDIEPLFCIATVAVAEENTPMAQHYYKEVLKLNPKHLPSLIATADLMLVDSRLNEAVDWYLKALAIEPAQPAAICKCAEAYSLLNMLDEGLEFLEKYKLDDFNEAVTLIKRNFLLLLKKEEEALVCTNALYENCPDKPQYVLELAESLKKGQKHAERERLYTKALGMNLQGDLKLTAHFERANTLLAQDKKQEALADFDEVLVLDPNAYYYKKRSEIKAQLKDLKGALSDLNNAIKLMPSFDSYHSRGKLYLRAKAYDKAIADFTKMVKMEGSNPEGYFELGVAFHSAGDKKKAFKMLLEAEVRGHKKAGQVLASKFGKQVTVMRERATSGFKTEFEKEYEFSANSAILKQIFGKFWVPNMQKFILAMGDDIYAFSKTMIENILATAEKDALLITPQGLLFFEGNNEPIEAYYKIEVESPHAVILELQPTKGGERSRMRLFIHDGSLVLSYPLVDTEVPARYFRPIEQNAVTAAQKERLRTKKFAGNYLDNIEEFINGCG